MTSGSLLLLFAVGFIAIAAAVCFPLGIVRSARNIRRDEPSDDTHDDWHGTVSTQRGSTPPDDLNR